MGSPFFLILCVFLPCIIYLITIFFPCARRHRFSRACTARTQLPLTFYGFDLCNAPVRSGRAENYACMQRIWWMHLFFFFHIFFLNRWLFTSLEWVILFLGDALDGRFNRRWHRLFFFFLYSRFGWYWAIWCVPCMHKLLLMFSGCAFKLW